MSDSVGLSRYESTLVACAVAEICDDCTEVPSLISALARYSGRSTGSVRYWLVQLWAHGLVHNGSTLLTLAGWVEFRRLRGEMSDAEADIWRGVAA